jgi:hypothetical protein
MTPGAPTGLKRQPQNGQGERLRRAGSGGAGSRSAAVHASRGQRLAQNLG